MAVDTARHIALLAGQRRKQIESNDDLIERIQWMRVSNRRVVERSERLVAKSIILLARIGFR